MAVHRVTRILPYAPEQLADLVADVRAYPDFVPWVTSMRVWNAREEGEGVGGCVVEDGAVDPGAAFRAGCLHPPLPQEGVASFPEAPDRLDDRPVVVPLVDESPDGGGDERGLPHARGPSTRTVEGPTG